MAVTRRNALALTGAGLTALAATSHATANLATASELETLIDDHRRAWDRFNAAVDAEGEFDMRKSERRELSLRTSLGFDIEVRLSRDLRETANDFHKEISGRYRGEMGRSISMLGKAAPVLGIQANEALRNAQAKDLRAMRQLVRDEQQRREASGYAACIREWQIANDTENDAMEALLLYRCRTPEELAHKAAYVGEALKHCVSIGVVTGPLIGSQKGPLPLVASGQRA